MPSYLHPGVYIEELASGNMPIEGVGTSTACMLGYCTQGPMATPVLVSSWNDYERTFGGLNGATTVVSGAAAPLADPMSSSVNAFFQNGGSATYVVRLATGTKASAGKLLAADGTTTLLTVTAANPGKWGDALVLRLAPKTAGGTTVFVATVGNGSGDAFVALEPSLEVVPETGQPTSIMPTINAASKLVQVSVPTGKEGALRTFLTTPPSPPPPPPASPPASPAPSPAPASPSPAPASPSPAPAAPAPAPVAGPTDVTLSGGDNGSAPASQDYQNALDALLKVRDINILLLPGQQWDGASGGSILSMAVSHCEAINDRMVVIDVPPQTELDDENAVDNLSLPTSTYAVTYYPWPLVANPFYDADLRPAAPRTVMIAPSAVAAGLWAKTDLRRGVWKAPAGIEFGLLGLSGLAYTVGNDEQDFLNPAGVNALRSMPGYGQVVWGARTLSTRANPEWRYVPVRRTAIFIEESIYNGIQWAVFEPNAAPLWSSLRANIESFMNGLFRAGAFQGSVASDAYFVRCGLGQTMTQDDIDRGQVIVLVAFAPLKPAEFVIVRIQQKVGQQ